MQEILDILMFLVAIVFLMAGFPVAFTLAGTALVFGLIGFALGVFDLSFLGLFPQRIFGTMTNEVLIAVPLFVFMGVMLEKSKVAEELLDNMGKLFGTLRGGLGISVTVVGALLAASTGIVGATVVTMGLLSLPTMLRRGYDPALATGTIAAAGTLGQIIPPSIVLVLLGDVTSSAFQNSQLAQGIFSPETVSVGDLFAGALLPGLGLVGMYILYQIGVAWLRPAASPPIPRDELSTDARSLLIAVLNSLVPPIALIVSVLGSILTGVATPTEAAAVGAIGATLLAGQRLKKGGGLPIYVAALSVAGLFIFNEIFDLRLNRDRPLIDDIGVVLAFLMSAGVVWGLAVSLWRTFGNDVLRPVMRSTTQITSMVFVILAGAALFSLVFRGLGGDETVKNLLTDMPGGDCWGDDHVMLVMFILGFFSGLHRDHVCCGADCGPGAADHGPRPGVARGDDGDEPADIVSDTAVRVRPVLFARGRAALRAHDGYLQGDHSVCDHPSGGAHAVGRVSAHRDLAARCGLWRWVAVGEPAGGGRHRRPPAQR